MIDEQLFIKLRSYILSKTGITYFNHIKSTPNDLMISCPFHKQGQERKPSCGVKLYTDSKGFAGTVHCFTCGVTTDISNMVKQILGTLYNEDEVESLFGLKVLATQTSLQQEESTPKFNIPKKSNIKESVLKTFRYYHPYLASRGITEQVAQIYDIGYDDINKHITFPIKTINNECVGIGRRSILEKRYLYPPGMIKPVYGIYELPHFLRYVWIVEGPFNMWTLRGWNKQSVALLGTGTSYQYKQLLTINCEGFVLALDGDEAGRNGIKKLKQFLTANHRKCYIAKLPDGKDINDLTYEQFLNMEVI